MTSFHSPTRTAEEPQTLTIGYLTVSSAERAVWEARPETTKPTPPPTPQRSTRSRWSAADSETTILVLVLKGLVLFLAALGIQTLFDQSESWHTLWTRWDASHYLSLAENGYTDTGDGRFSIVFYPLYPWLVRAVAFVWQSYFGAALLVSGAASVCAALLLRRLVELDHPAKVARLTVWFLFIFPTAYFLHIGYTESLFLALVVGSVLAARKQYWAVAGMLGALACLTRVNGLLLVPTLMVEAWLQYRVARRINWRWLWIAAPGLGFAAYLFLNYRVTGDPFAFSKIMEEHWYKKITPPWIGIQDVWHRIFTFNLTEGLHEFIFIVLSFLATVWCWKKLRPTYAVWMTLNWLLITSTTFVVSVPRYCLTLFPIFIILARLAAGRPLVGRIVSAASLLLLALFAMKFAHGTWAF
jgi:Gpi18-like mannosyltransferase